MKNAAYIDLYRFRLSRALFTEPRGGTIPPEYQSCFYAMDLSSGFLSIFKPWEVEELACICNYIVRRYTEILQENYSEIAKHRPKKCDGESSFVLSQLKHF